MEWTRAYHNLRRDSAHIDGIREAALHHHLGDLILNGLQENRIEVSLAWSILPCQNAILSRGHAGDRKDTELIRRCGAEQVRVVPVRRDQNHRAIGDRFILSVSEDTCDDPAG